MTSPSSYGRERACLASVVLPHSRSEGLRMVRGDELHKFMLALSLARTDEERSEAILDVPEEWRSAAAAIDLPRFPPFRPHTRT